MMIGKSTAWLRSTVVFSAALLPMATFAQGVPAPSVDDSPEIMVTATRRSEPLQRVPIAISVLTGDLLRAANLNGVSGIAREIPSLNFRTSASSKDQAIFIRGQGTVSTSPGVEPSVSTVLDGVVLAR